MLNKIGWFVIFVGGLLAVILAWMEYGTDGGIPALLGWGGIAWAWAALSSWWLGLRRVARKHLKTRIADLTFITKEIGASRRVDYIRVLESLASEQGIKPIGINRNWTLKMLEHTDGILKNVTWESVETEDERIVNIPDNAVFQLSFDKTPFLVQVVQTQAEHHYDYENEGSFSTGKGDSLQLCCAGGLAKANDVLQWLNSQTSQHSVFREKMIIVASPQDGSSGQTIRVVNRPVQTADDIILPDSIIKVVDRLIHSHDTHQVTLQRYGHQTKLGLLFHGPPGTGKTLLNRKIVSDCKSHTVIVPTDMAVETLREAFRLAQYLQPSIMILEDVDLLASERQTSRSVDGLQELMNQLDGLIPTSETIVLMSTNRPKVLESALASRPGRISQAVEFPLPDDAARGELFQLFLSNVYANVDRAEWINRTAGASPAFIRELCKRAVLMAVEEHGVASGEPPEINNDHLNSAIHELVVMGGDLTASALGFPKVC